MAARTFPLESVSELASMVGMDGVGAVGDLIGTTDTQFTTTTATTPGATRFITVGITTEEAHEATFAAAPTRGTGLLTEGTLASEAEFTEAKRRGLSTETIALPEGTRNPAVKAACAPAPSAVTTVADRPGVFRHAGAPASEAEERVVAQDLAAAVAEAAGIGNRWLVVSGHLAKFWKMEKAICSK